MEAIEQALVASHLVPPHLARAAAITASRAGCPLMWAQMRKRLDEIEMRFGLPSSYPGEE